jgi:hypothetical protein
MPKLTAQIEDKILQETFGVAMRDSTLLLFLLFGLFMFTAAFTAVPA